MNAKKTLAKLEMCYKAHMEMLHNESLHSKFYITSNYAPTTAAGWDEWCTARDHNERQRATVERLSKAVYNISNEIARLKCMCVLRRLFIA